MSLVNESIPKWLEDIKFIDTIDLTKKFNVVCTREECKKPFLRSIYSTNWNCSKCRKAVSRKSIREQLKEEIQKEIDPTFAIEIQKQREEKNKIKVEKEGEPMEEEKKADSKQSKISPKYISEVTHSNFFSDPDNKNISQKKKSKIDEFKEIASITPILKESVSDINEITKELGLTEVFGSIANFFDSRTELNRTKKQLMLSGYIEEEEYQEVSDLPPREF